jgi:hypothetical protein
MIYLPERNNNTGKEFNRLIFFFIDPIFYIIFHAAFLSIIFSNEIRDK